MRIDAHQHFWRYEPVAYDWIDDSMARIRRDFLPSDLAPELAVAGFDGCVAVQARQSLEETDFLLELAAENPIVRGVVGWVDIQSPDLDQQLDRYQDSQHLKGIRHIVQAEADDRFLLRPAFLEGIAQLQPRGLTYDILIFPKHLPVAYEFASRFPEQPFVVDHLAKPFIAKDELEPWATDIRRLAELPHVCCKLSGMVTEATWNGWTLDDLRPYADVLLDAFGPDRLMIGSDWPVCLVAAGTYAETMGAYATLLTDLSPAEQDAVLGENAAQFYRLNLA